MIIQPVILAGGSGTRLWPLSRELYPKQLLPLVGDNTMLQETVNRLDGLSSELANPLVICNEEHRFLVAEQVRQLGKQCASIILEPVGRNTAPALTLAALAAKAAGTDPVLFVMPADHVIQNTVAFHQATQKATLLAEEGGLVTFGIVATGPETGYGYIKRGLQLGSSTSYQVDSFVEKPDAKTAEGYIATGDYYWNSGMFMMKASVWLEEIAIHRADILSACEKAWQGGAQDQDFYRVDKNAFEACPSDSIDYAVMEKATGKDSRTRVAVVPLDADWSDVGAWSSLWEVSAQDNEG
ncbi:MAG: mannose-1-phosphate guanylyltransferase/mannose-6-phosphate isomerase, partial [Gammaproteobacteria bacterium]|nr:mannose-1-phosphate guanylyltransferase/mannose-6-phosphate isomerase [Gammaproteobacteria bacterium]